MDRMARARIPEDVGLSAVRSVVRAGDGVGVTRDQLATAVRYTLQALADRAPGNTVEVRVPPFGAVQCIPGPRHTRGTPPNVIETDAPSWLAMATGSLTWSEARGAGKVSASGQRADLTGLLPLIAV
jgi:hypothetical protein